VVGFVVTGCKSYFLRERERDGEPTMVAVCSMWYLFCFIQLIKYVKITDNYVLVFSM
jgi:hypothetical protein